MAKIPFRSEAVEEVRIIWPLLISSPVGLNSSVKNPPLKVRRELVDWWISLMVRADFWL